MTKTLHFGKIAYSNPKRRANSVEVEIRLKEAVDGHKEFSAVGAIWNSNHTDWESGGQILPTLRKYIKGDSRFDELADLWEKHHLNGLHAGTRKQEKIVRDYFDKEEKTYDYTTACKVLEENGLYEDSLGEEEHISCGEGLDRNRYKYGTGWVLWGIPEADMKRIEKLFEGAI